MILSQEERILLYRYLYYVKAISMVPDSVYDMIERGARAHLPPDSPVHKVGSSLPSSYPDKIKNYAEELISGK